MATFPLEWDESQFGKRFNVNSKDPDQPVEICSMIRNLTVRCCVLQYPTILLAVVTALGKNVNANI